MNEATLERKRRHTPAIAACVTRSTSMGQKSRFRDELAGRFKDIQLPQIRSFCLAALEKSFSAAARSQSLSVATVWQHVRVLEQRLGTTLLRAEGRSLQLTPEGKLLLELVHPHLSGLESLGRIFESRS